MSASREPIYVVDKLSKSYGSTLVLNQVSFELHRGESLIIMGRSGVGKSVALRQLNGLEQPDSGTVTFDGVCITGLGEADLYPIRKRVAMLFQSGALFDSMTVLDNIAFPMREHTSMDSGEIRARVAEKLELVGLSGIEEKMPSSLSGGMRKRVALARSLALDPEVVLFDEPTTGLDPVTSASIGHLMRSTQSRLGVSAVVVSHDIALARTAGDRIAFLHEGRFRFIGTWDEADDSDDALLEGFLAGRTEEQHAA